MAIIVQPMAREPALSYKFQRLRERLRSAVASGELTGKLPGERSLARRFHVNAKTLSKALTDLAAEGLLHRSIGRGTYVRPSGGAAADLEAIPGRWLILCDPGREDSSLVRLLQQSNAESLVTADAPGCARPSFLKSFAAVVDLAAATPEPFLRDLIVRNIPLVSINREPDVHSLNLIAADLALGAHALARDLILGGHRRLVVVETVPRSPVGRAVALAAQRYGGAEATSIVTSKDQVTSEFES